MHRLRFVLLLEGHAARDAATGTSPTPNRSGFEVAFCDLNLGWSWKRTTGYRDLHITDTGTVSARRSPVKDEGRYDVSDLPEAQFEPGSNGTVLKNLLGITSAEEIEVRETDALERATESLVKSYDATHRFVAADVRSVHRIWLHEIYAWAGEYRQVNVSKGGFPFASAARIPPLMEAFEKGPLRQHTPCAPGSQANIASALAEVHVELVLIHPFREGNGRVARLLSTLMALQAGIPFLYFGMISDERKADYFAAIQAGMDRNYQPMKDLFSEVIEISIGRASA